MGHEGLDQAAQAAENAVVGKGAHGEATQLSVGQLPGSPVNTGLPAPPEASSDVETKPTLSPYITLDTYVERRDCIWNVVVDIDCDTSALDVFLLNPWPT